MSALTGPGNRPIIKRKTKMKVIRITKVKEESGWLSCMSAYPVTYNGQYYRTCEALFQARRFNDYPEIQKEIIECKSPMGAKMIARRESRIYRGEENGMKHQVIFR